MKSSKRSRRVSAVAASAVAVLAASCGSSADQVAVEPPRVSEQTGSTVGAVSSDPASPSQEAVDQWIDLLRSASINQIYDRDYPASLEQLAKASDFHVAGKIASVEIAEPQPMNLAPDPASEPLPFDPDLVVRGVTLVLDDASVVGADGADLGLRGGSMRVNVMVFSGPGTATTADDFIAKIRSTAPIVVYQFNTFTNDFSMYCNDDFEKDDFRSKR